MEKINIRVGEFYSPAFAGIKAVGMFGDMLARTDTENI